MAMMAPLANMQVWRFSLYYFFVFGGFAALAFLFSWRIVPETKGRTLEELERELAS